MKKGISLVLSVALLSVALCGCGKKDPRKTQLKRKSVNTQYQIDYNDPDLTPEMLANMKPEEIQIKNICKLATLEVYFHSVAKAVKPANSGLSGINQQDRKFWIEYSGYATVGIDMSRVDMKITGNVVNVRMPHATLLGDVKVDSSSYDMSSLAVESQSAWKTNNPINAEDVTKSIRESNLYTTRDILNNKSRMLTAEARAEDYIRRYINQIAAYAQKTYTVQFEYIETTQ